MKEERVNFLSGLAVAFGLMLLAASVALAAQGRASGPAFLLLGGALLGAGACYKTISLIGRK